MSADRLTALLLIIGPIVAILGFLAWFWTIGDVDQSDIQGVIRALGENEGGVRVAAMLLTLGILFTTAGLGGIKKSMAGGSGHPIAALGFFLMIIGMAGHLAESGLAIATSNASAKAAAAVAAGSAESAAAAGSVATAVWAASQGIGAAGTALAFLGLGILGYGLLVQKNFNAIIAGLVIVFGVIGVIVPIVDYQSQLMAIPYLGFVIISIAMGVISIRSGNQG